MIKNVGPVSFILGIIVAVIVGVIDLGSGGTYLLLLLGAIVGLLNIQPDEEVKYLIGIVALLFSSNSLKELLEVIPAVGVVLGDILSAIIIFLASGAAVVSLKVLIELAKD